MTKKLNVGLLYLVRHGVSLEVAGEPRHLLTRAGRSHLLLFSPGRRDASVLYTDVHPAGRHRRTHKNPLILLFLLSSCFEVTLAAIN